MKMVYAFSDQSRFEVYSKRQGWGHFKDSVRYYSPDVPDGRWATMKELDEKASKSERNRP